MQTIANNTAMGFVQTPTVIAKQGTINVSKVTPMSSRTAPLAAHQNFHPSQPQRIAMNNSKFANTPIMSSSANFESKMATKSTAAPVQQPAKWGQTQIQVPAMGGNQFMIDQIESFKQMTGMAGSKFSKPQAAQPKESITFEVSNSSSQVNEIKENFQDSSFGVSAQSSMSSLLGNILRPQYASRGRAVSLCAVPKWAEGEWGAANEARKYMVGGNWKSNGDLEFSQTFPKDVLMKAEYNDKNVDVTVAPTYVHLNTVNEALQWGKKVKVCAQDVSEFEKGAYTGNITADQLVDMKVQWTLTGHSERRTLFGETDEITAIKTKMAVENGMSVMLCIGEVKDERESGVTDSVNARQLKAVADIINEEQWGNIVVAYEPVWAIGTGLVATPEQAQETQLNIRKWLCDNISPKVAAETRILYGGSANAQNAPDLICQPDIDGFLVGGASLKPDFLEIIKAVDEHKKK